MPKKNPPFSEYVFDLIVGGKSAKSGILKVEEGVVCLSLTGMFFDTNKNFLLPSAMKGMQNLVEIYDKHPNAEMLIVGHADTSGQPSYNDPLSVERANAVAAFVTDDVDAWLERYNLSVSYEKRWGTIEDFHMLESLADFPTKPKDQAAVEWFQETRNLDVDNVAGPQTRKQLIKEYMDHDKTTLPAGITMVTHGCGENFPLNEVGEVDPNAPDGKSDAQDRRVEIFVFDPPGIRPKPSGKNSKKGSQEYLEWRKISQKCREIHLPKENGQIIKAYWGSDFARNDAEKPLQLKGDTKDFPSGTPAKFRIFEHMVHENDIDKKPGANEKPCAGEELVAKPKFIKKVDGMVNDNVATAEWPFDHENDQISLLNKYKGDEDTGDLFSTDDEYFPPQYFFDLIIEDSSARSNLLDFRDKLELDLVNENDVPLSGVEYIAYFADGSKKLGTNDSNGKIKEEDVPPGWVHIKLTNKEIATSARDPREKLFYTSVFKVKTGKVQKLKIPNYLDGDGKARGCGTIAIFPSWVQATPTPGDRGPQPVGTVEGTLALSKITHEDFPLLPWHNNYDWNFFVRVDPQYMNLVSVANLNDSVDEHYVPFFSGRKDGAGIFECEWDSAFFPPWAFPQQGDRIWMVGRWIYDCGHPYDHGYKTEIHPPKAVVSFRSKAMKLPGNNKSTRANVAVLYIGKRGGYFDQTINDQDYEFKIPLPPKPSADSQPLFLVQGKNFNGDDSNLPFEPIITPIIENFGAELKVKIPFFGQQDLDEYGAIIAGGWSDSSGISAQKTIPVKVIIKEILMHANLDPLFGDEWHVYVGVNGSWKVFKDIGGFSEDLNYEVDLDLHPKDKIHVTVCGFEADAIHESMGGASNVPAHFVHSRLSSAEVVAASALFLTRPIAGIVAGLSQLTDTNDKISMMSETHPADSGGTFKTHTKKAKDSDYSLIYEIRRR